MSLSRVTTALFLFAALVLIVAGCGGSGSSSTSTSSETSASSGGGEMTVSTGEVPGLGTVLVDSEGLTVYMFAKDQGSTSSCYGACEQGWPPVVAEGKPSGEGSMASQLGTTKRKDGTMQVTFEGRPLYTFAGDTAPGEANGNESTAFGGKWSAMDEAGEAVAGTATSETEEAPEEETSESSSGGYGY